MKPPRLVLLTMLCLAMPMASPADEPPARDKPRPRPNAGAKALTGRGDEATKFRYRGLTIDVSALSGTDRLEAVLPSLRRQVDIAVEARVKPEIAEFFRTIPVALGPVPGGGPGFCFGRSVVMTSEPLPFDRVVLLHEFLHAYHNKLTPDQKRQVTRSYEKATRAYGMPTTEYFLTNVNEFFAVTSSIHLHGQIPRPPRTREAIRAAQPEYARLLTEIFDPPPAASPRL